MMEKSLFSFLAICLMTNLTPGVHTAVDKKTSNFTMNLCITGHNSEVQSGEIFMNGSQAGYIIALSRSSKRVKAKYFAFKQNGMVVHDRYDQWRSGKNVVLISSGAYATGFQGTDIPIGLTVDSGNKVNDVVDPKMDALVIVEEVGGVRISDIDAGDLTIKTPAGDKKIDIRNSFQKVEFLKWCETERATVFQSHLLIYKNQLKFNKPDSEQAVRKLLVLMRDNSGNIYHLIVYSKFRSLSLYEMASSTLGMLNSYGYDVIAAANLDTGAIDVLNTSTELFDCSRQAIEGLSNKDRRSVSNMLAYYYE